jgi:hypothetical protein
VPIVNIAERSDERERRASADPIGRANVTTRAPSGVRLKPIPARGGRFSASPDLSIAGYWAQAISIAAQLAPVHDLDEIEKAITALAAEPGSGSSRCRRRSPRMSGKSSN